MTDDGSTMRDELLELHRSGQLVSAISTRFWRAQGAAREEAFETFAALHNAGELDLLALATGSEVASLKGYGFFAAQHFLNGVLPRLSATTAQMMGAVSRLVELGGNDMAANEPNGAFREWCRADPARSAEIIAHARAGDSTAIDHLAFALEALQDLETTRALLLELHDKGRLAVLTALSRTPHSPEEALNTLRTLATLLPDPTDDVLAGAVAQTVLEVLRHAPENDVADEMALGSLRLWLIAPGDNAKFQLARALWGRSTPSRSATEFVLSCLADLNPEHKGTIDNLDQALRQMLERGECADLAIHAIEQLLGREDGTLQFEQFKSFGSALLSGPRKRFQETFVRWMVGGNPVLCEGIAHLFRLDGPHDSLLLLDSEVVPPESADQVLLCERAVAYFFIRPVLAASVIVGTLACADASSKRPLEDLLAGPLLTNYGGALRQFLESVSGEHPGHEIIHAALRRNVAYLEGLNSVGRIPELRPSEHQRQLERVRTSDSMREAMKAAHKESSLLSLIHKSVLLYGRSSVTYVGLPGEARRPVKMELKSHGIEMEFPRTEHIDPLGIDFMIRVLRSRRRP